ncbi:hypothetical protein EDB85DRAFT_1900078 [Lactarius pseudohatsudake]|nr:hypothetical protein EDB85DRAFT_1900078 [Lactarius pseudohatsudake]
MTGLEVAARGYMECLDPFNPMQGFKSSRSTKRAKASVAALTTQSNHTELIHLTGAGRAPDWFPRTQEVWMHAVGHVSHINLASTECPRRFAYPPVHLFWGGKPPNQCLYFYHFLILFNEIKNWPEGDLAKLTTRE